MVEQAQHLDPLKLRKYEIVSRASLTTTANALLGTEIRERKYLPDSLETVGIGESPILILKEQRIVTTRVNKLRTYIGKNPIVKSTIYTALIADTLRSRRLNQVLWEIAPSTNFGLDTRDLILDWRTLLHKDPAHAKTLARHESLGKPWRVFRHWAPFQLRGIEGNIQDSRLPVIQWSKTEKEKRRLIYSGNLLAEAAQATAARFVNNYFPTEAIDKVFDPVAGAYVLALFSPDQRAHWPSNMGIDAKGNQVMGSTQAGLLTLVKDKDLVNAPFIKAAEMMADKGDIVGSQSMPI